MHGDRYDTTGADVVVGAAVERYGHGRDFR
jgi:hypothetical protein